jgi:hypothetical protein
MSKHETPMTRWYWEKINRGRGLLIEEFGAIRRNEKRGHNKRHIDGVIVLGQPAERRGPRKGDRKLVRDKEVIVIQSKARRLGMSLIGQVVVSRELLINLKAKTVKSVGVCKEDDKILRRILRRFEGCSAVVHTSRKKTRG